MTKPLLTFLDEPALGLDTLFVSGGRRGLEIELVACDLVRVCQAKTAFLCRQTGRVGLW